MKRNDWILAFSVLLYSLLFYNQTAGINFFIFNLALIMFLYVKDKKTAKNFDWSLAALGCLLSSVCVTIHGNALAVTANIISLSLLSSLSVDARTSVVISLLHSVYSYVSTPVFVVIDYYEKRALKEANTTTRKRSWLLIVVPIVITLVFFFIYRSSSTLFDALASKINLDFISWDWIVFTSLGFFLIYGFFYQKRIDGLNSLDNASDNLSGTNLKPSIFFGKELSMVDENFSATLLFVLLNVLLLIVNGLDINFMFGGSKLPLGVTHKQFVHQGTDMLITSIIIAIALILFYFRGALNFYEKNKTVKTLASLWVIQNAFMLFSTACRNYSYIDEYGLTYKRIGVYVYLLLTLVGLATTLIKIQRAKSNMYLFRKNGWIFYMLLIILAFPDWSRIVTCYNVKHIKDVDADYLLSLSDAAIPNILPYIENRPAESELTLDSLYRRRRIDENYCVRLYHILDNHEFTDPRSWCYDDMKVYNEVTSPEFTDKFTVLDLSEVNITDRVLKLFSGFHNINELHLHYTKTMFLQNLLQFSNVRTLDLSYNSIRSIKGIETLSKLETLDLRNDAIYDYSPLYSLKNLKELHLSNIRADDYDKLCKELPNTRIDKISSYYN